MFDENCVPETKTAAPTVAAWITKLQAGAILSPIKYTANATVIKGCKQAATATVVDAKVANNQYISTILSAPWAALNRSHGIYLQVTD